MYLHRGAIKDFVQQYRWGWLGVCVALSVAWYFVPDDDGAIIMVKNTILFMPWLMYAISVDSCILSNKVMKYLSGISLELYLAQMVMFRLIEKVHCLYLAGHGWASFMLVWIGLVIGLIVFIEIWKRLWELAQRKMKLES